MNNYCNKIIRISDNELRINSVDLLWIVVTIVVIALATLFIVLYIPYPIFKDIVKHWVIIDLWISVLVYYLFIDDIIINLNKTIKKDSAFIYVRNRKYSRDDIEGIYITYGPGAGIGSYFSKRVTLIYYKKNFRRRKHLITVRSDTETKVAAKIIADFLETTLTDNTNSGN